MRIREPRKLNEKGRTVQTLIIISILILLALGASAILYNIIADESDDIEESSEILDDLTLDQFFEEGEDEGDSESNEQVKPSPIPPGPPSTTSTTSREPGTRPTTPTFPAPPQPTTPPSPPTTPTTPTPPEDDIVGSRSYAVGGLHTCAVNDDTTARCWGDNEFGQLGSGSAQRIALSSDALSHSTVDIEGITQISAGYAHTCAVVGREDTAYCWGRNSRGQLGDGTYNDRSNPTRVQQAGSGDTLDGVMKISAGYAHTCAIVDTDSDPDNGGSVHCWGWTFEGALGDGSTASDTANLQNPSELASPTGSTQSLENVVDISASIFHTCAATSGGNVYCWGSNLHSKLGDGGTTSDFSLIPIQVVGSGGSGSLGDVTSIVTGIDHTCAIVGDTGDGGDVYCWGSNRNEQLGVGSTSSRESSSPVQVVAGASGSGSLEEVIQISAGAYHTCAIKEDLDVYCWGSDRNYELGLNPSDRNPTPGSSSPTAKHIPASTIRRARQLSTLDGEPIVLAVGSFATHGCLGYTEIDEETIYCWGNNSHGQRGIDFTTSQSEPVQVVAQSGSGFLEDVIKITTGSEYACAIVDPNNDLADGGDAYCWGKNQYGRLGNGQINEGSTRPAVVLGPDTSSQLTTVHDISAGISHTCAIAGSQKALYCWGRNANGQLGDTDARATANTRPLLVSGTGTSETYGEAMSVSAGRDMTCAIFDDGDSNPGGNAYCWGRNSEGQIGDDTTSARFVPVPVSGPDTDNDGSGDGTLGNVLSISAGFDHVCAIVDTNTNAADGGDAYCWGANRSGQLGSGEREDPTSADPMAADLGLLISSPFPVKVADTTMAEPFEIRFSFNQVTRIHALDSNTLEISNVLEISAGYFSTCAVISTASAGTTTVNHASAGTYCWGSNEHGQLGWGGDSEYARLGVVDDIEEYEEFVFIDRPLVPVLSSPQASGTRKLVDTAVVSLGQGHACAVTNGGVAYCWGRGASGERGDGSSVHSSLYRNQVQTLTGVKSISSSWEGRIDATTRPYNDLDSPSGAGGEGNYESREDYQPIDTQSHFSPTATSFTCAIVDDDDAMEGGDLYCWGWNEFGSLGNNQNDRSGKGNLVTLS